MSDVTSEVTGPTALQMRLVAQLAFDPREAGERQYISEGSNPRRCRFCLRAEREIRPGGQPAGFKKDAHALPEAIGNRYLLSREECDECNSYASLLESDFSQLIAIPRAFARINGKEGPVKHRFGKRDSFVTSIQDRSAVEVYNYEEDDSLQMRRVPHGLAYTIKVGKYRPANAVRCLARMAFFLLPANLLREFDHVRRWIRGETTFAVDFYAGLIPGPGMRRVSAKLAATELDGVRAYQFILYYGSELFCFVMPNAEHKQELPEIPPMRSPYHPHDVKWNRLTVTKEGHAEQRFETIEIAVPALAGLPLPTIDDIRVAAYYRRMECGCSEEHDLNHWLEGEQDEACRQMDSVGLSVPIPAEMNRAAKAAL